MTPTITPEALDYTPGELDRTAPARIWLQIDTTGDNSERSEPWAGSEGVTWQDEQIGGLEIEYVRADIALQAAPAAAGVPDKDEARGQIEFLDRQNDSLRRAIHAIMAKLAFLLDEDQFADVDAIALTAGVSPPAQPAAQPQAEQWEEIPLDRDIAEVVSNNYTKYWDNGDTKQPQAEQQGADERFPNGLADAVAYADAMEHAAAALFEQVLGHETDGSETGPEMLARVATAITSRQPVGEPVLRIYAQGSMRALTEWLDGSRDLADGDHLLYTAPPAAVDLGQFRDAITREYANSRALCDMPRILECERLLALIDRKAVRNG